MAEVKVPKTIQEVLDEATACRTLATLHSRWLIPSPKAVMYSIKAAKLEQFAWKTLAATNATVRKHLVAGVTLEYCQSLGVAIIPDPVPTAKPRRPRTKKAAPDVTPTTTQGE